MLSPQMLSFLHARASTGFHVRPNAMDSAGKSIFRSLRLVGISNTRWLSVAAAVTRALNQRVELKLHLEVTQSAERCYTAGILHEMFQDEKNYLYMLFVKPIDGEFGRVSRLFQSENLDPVTLFNDLDLLVRTMLSEVVLNEHARPFASRKRMLWYSLLRSFAQKLSFGRREGQDARSSSHVSCSVC